MNVYLAEGGNMFKVVSGCRQERRWKDANLSSEAQFQNVRRSIGGTFDGVNILQSFYYCDNFTEEVIIPNCKNFLLDSGAFTFFSAGKTVDWKEYVKRYADFINKNNITHFFELDIDVLIGYEKTLLLREMLQDLTGKPVIPVWHKSRGRERFYEMCEQYNYVAIGGIVSREITQRDYPIFTHLITEAHKRGAKIHGLGYTNLTGIQKYHFDSVDSTAWTSGVRFGTIHSFNGKTIVSHKGKSGQRVADYKQVALHNFNEWVKFQKYAEYKL